MPKKCKYGKNGCNFEQMPSRKQIFNDHETVCPHRDVTCFQSNCSKNVPLANLLVHLKTAPQHKVPPFEVIGGQDSNFTQKFTVTPQYLQFKGWTTWYPLHLTLNNQKEFYIQIVRSSSGFFFIWVYTIGTPKEEYDFTYTITVFDINKVYL